MNHTRELDVKENSEISSTSIARWWNVNSECKECDHEECGRICEHGADRECDHEDCGRFCAYGPPNERSQLIYITERVLRGGPVPRRIMPVDDSIDLGWEHEEFRRGQLHRNRQWREGAAMERSWILLSATQAGIALLAEGDDGGYRPYDHKPLRSTVVGGVRQRRRARVVLNKEQALLNNS